jgi:internalin A
MDEQEILSWIRTAKHKNLDGFDLSNNHITTLPPQIGDLDNITVLDVSNTGLIEVPPEIGKLRNLRILKLAKNQLTDLPKEISQLTELISLDISGNHLTKLPLEIFALTKIKHLDLRDNDLNIPPEILENVDAPEKILNYYSNIAATEADEEVDIEKLSQEVFKRIRDLDLSPFGKRLELQFGKPINEIKLLIVGQGSVGKTSLVQRILNGTFDQNQTKTEGISINQWQVKGSQGAETRNGGTSDSRSPNDDAQISNSNIRLNIWDFGGQEIMHATHQFFLTKRSLYLLVLDARLTQEENRTEYWLKIIQSFGADSPVTIVGNKTDQHPLDIDRTGLQKKYPNIVGIIETSAATGAGINALKAAIMEQVHFLPHVRDLLPETWFTVKSKLEELGRAKNFITQDEYLSLCAANEVTDEISQRTLISFLHDLGVVLHFQDDARLEALGILNPQWVTNGVYKILNSHELFQNQGQLTLPILNTILNLPEYPRGEKRMYIVDMMKKFELCYDIEPDKVFLIPDLLPKDEPEGVELKGVPAFQYQYPVLPSSVITRFIVRMNKYIENNVAWRTGVRLKLGNNIAIVKADIEDKTISIYVDGLEHTRRDALSAIRYQLDEIHDTIKGLNPQKRVPVPEAPNAEPLEYDYLLQLERDGYEEFPVKDGTRLVKIDVRKLLSAIESEAKRKESAGNVTNIYVGGDVGGNIVVGDENSVENSRTIFKSIYHAIDECARNETEKQVLTAEVDDIQAEVAKGDQANESFLSRRLRNLKKMAPDIAEVALTVLTNPSGIVSAVVQKIAKKIQEEAK